MKKLNLFFTKLHSWETVNLKKHKEWSFLKWTIPLLALFLFLMDVDFFIGVPTKSLEGYFVSITMILLICFTTIFVISDIFIVFIAIREMYLDIKKSKLSLKTKILLFLGIILFIIILKLFFIFCKQQTT